MILFRSTHPWRARERHACRPRLSIGEGTTARRHVRTGITLEVGTIWRSTPWIQFPRLHGDDRGAPSADPCLSDSQEDYYSMKALFDLVPRKVTPAARNPAGSGKVM